MNKLLKFLENNWQRHILWAIIVIIIFTVYISFDWQIPSTTFTLLLVLLVVISEMITGYFLKKRSK